MKKVVTVLAFWSWLSGCHKRLMDGGTLMKCGEFGDAVIQHMG